MINTISRPGGENFSLCPLSPLWLKIAAGVNIFWAMRRVLGRAGLGTRPYKSPCVMIMFHVLLFAIGVIGVVETQNFASLPDRHLPDFLN
jgi:hypothetical protein